MLALLAKPIIGQIAGPASAVLLALLLVARCDNAVLSKRLETARSEAATAKFDLGTCQANGETLTNRLKDQNAKLADLEAAGKALEADAARRLAEARKQTSAAQREAQKLLRPLTAPDQCSRVLEADRRVLDGL
jgi:hypothetical protein